ncbi:hypothetical protein ACQUJS_12150 [Ralstonia pseudosolanacearum]|uniref:Uncharacterized protein n=1 Tax=Ralstonia solanacearum TaxID=305 RepID=A0A0S4TSC8_RALSL|nr:conserved protein of unknown function [Ralstonia solanacearum]
MAHRTDPPRIREDDPKGKDIPTSRRNGTPVRRLDAGQCRRLFATVADTVAGVPEGILRTQAGTFIGADPAHGAGARTAPGLRSSNTRCATNTDAAHRLKEKDHGNGADVRFGMAGVC